MNHGDYVFTKRLSEFRRNKKHSGFKIRTKEDLIEACALAHTYDTYRDTLVLLAKECSHSTIVNKFEISMKSKLAFGEAHGYKKKTFLRHMRVLIIDGLIKEIAPKRFIFDLETLEWQSTKNIPAALLIISK